MRSLFLLVPILTLTPPSAVTDEKLISALAPALDKRNLPMLIHCNKGKVCPTLSLFSRCSYLTISSLQHRTGCVVGCIRRLQGLALPEVFDEYRKHSHPKSRDMDITCIEDFAGLPEVRFPLLSSDLKDE